MASRSVPPEAVFSSGTPKVLILKARAISPPERQGHIHRHLLTKDTENGLISNSIYHANFTQRTDLSRMLLDG
ncbi:hypothetical protein [Roseibium litorale]|uniref:Uncharacterized protein n=1 Tax=Roseibium litorale TaxID=2803841 RepID=A0ABR9CGC2_9HYPH|nr:hypothetical protein [Roseibium litorale]MBD8889955.1 hypothetical protein [Roseibium litorale]